MNQHANIKKLALIIAAVSVVFSGDSTAQESGGLEEIIVTAQRRAESLQTVPVSVDVQTAKDLASKSINNFVDLAKNVPSFYTDDATSNKRIAIRGYGSTGSDIIETPVVILLDEAYISNARLISNALYDVDRIEILRGPQGTLFGKNAIAGVVHVLTREPTEDFGGYVNLEGGDYHYSRLDSAVSGKIMDHLYGRISAVRSYRGPWMNNIQKPDGGGLDDKAVRIRLRWDITERLTASFKYEWLQHWDEGSTNQLLEIRNPSALLNTPRFQLLSERDLETKADRKQSVGPGLITPGTILDRRTKGQGQTANLQLIKLSYDTDSGYNLSSLTSRSDYTNKRRLDASFTPIGSLPVWNYQDYITIAEDFQIQSPDTHRFSWIGGIYLEKTKTTRGGPSALDFDAGGKISSGVIENTLLSPWYVLDPANVSVASSGVASIRDALISQAGLSVDLGPGLQKLERKIWSTYFEGRFDVTDALRVTVGGRYSKDKLNGKKDFINRNAYGSSLSSTDWIDSFVTDTATYPGVQAAAAAYPGGISAGALAPGFPIMPLPDDFYAAVRQTLGLAYSYIQLPDGVVVGKQDKGVFTYSAKIQYSWSDDVMWYGSIATGYKGGGFNFDAVTPTTATEFEREKAIGYEIGSKSTFLDGALKINAAIFRTNFDDLQVTSINPQNTFTFRNAASARSQGVELDVAWHISDEWLLNLSHGYIDAKYRSFPGAPCRIDDPNAGSTCTQDMSGQSLMYAPKNTTSFYVTFFHSLVASWELEASLGIVHRDGFSVSGPNDLWADRTTLLSGRLALTNVKEQWTIAVRGTNLTNEDAVWFRQPQALYGNNIITGAIVPPRMFALQFSKNFE